MVLVILSAQLKCIQQVEFANHVHLPVLIALMLILAQPA